MHASGLSRPSQQAQSAPRSLHNVKARHHTPVLATASNVQAPGLAKKSFSKVHLSTAADCKLEIFVFPTFAYNAVGGGGWATVQELPGGLQKLTFDPNAVVIPPLSYKTASIFGVPVPPPLNIAIQPLQLEGTLDPNTGEMNLTFDARFNFTAGPIYKAKPLTVRTVLTTESTEGQFKRASGSRLTADGKATLVGAAVVPKVDDWFMDTFLGLPTDALAIMSASFKFE